MNGHIGIYLNLDSNSKNNLFKNNHLNNISQPISKVNPQEVIAIANTKKNTLPSGAEAIFAMNQVSINITNPKTQNQTIFTNFITVNGTTSDSGNSRIKKVDVLLTKIPSNGTAVYKLAIPSTQGWSRWSFPVVLQKTGLYLIKARVTDGAGNQA